MEKRKKEDSNERLIRETTDRVKVDFLQKALEKNEVLRSQFIRYCTDLKKGEQAKQEKKPAEIIAKTSGEVRSQLEALDFENMNWREYIPRHSGYIEDYEAWENFADDHLTEVFEIWQHQICQRLQQGELTHGICQFIGCYTACFDVEIPGSEDVFEDLTIELLGHHQELLNAVVDTLEEVTGSEKEVRAAVAAILDHYQGIREGHPDFLKYMEPVLLMITETAETARYISEQIELRDLDESLVPQVALRIASFDEDPLIWREKAEEFIDADLEVAKQLLDHYWLNDPECFRLQGKRLFRLHPHELCDFFRERLFPLFDQDFFREVLWFQTLRDRQVKQYEELREHLDDAAKNKIIEEIAWDDVFKVKVLEIEQRYEEILNLVRKEVNSTWHFTELITPILNIYPAEVFDLIKIKTTNTVEHQKGRHSYQRISVWLKLSLQIKGKEDDARHLIHELYNRRPALPALKDEMRKAGVVI